MKASSLQLIFFLFAQLLVTQPAAAQTASDSLIQRISLAANDSLQAILHWEAGVALKREGKIDEAIDHYEKALALSLSRNDQQHVAKCYNSLGLVYVVKGSYKEALESYLNSLRIHEQLEDKGGLLKNYINLGNFFAMQQDFDKSVKYYENALALVEEGQDPKNEALLNLNLGSLYTDPRNPNGDLTKALAFYEKAKLSMLQLQDSISLAGIFNNIGVLKEQQNKLQEAYENYLQALEIRRQLGDIPGLAQSYNNLGNIERHRNKHEKAIDYYHLSMEQSRKIKALNQVQHALHNLSGTHFEMGNYQKAYEYRVRYDLLKDSIFNEEKSQQLAELETRYETEKKDQQLLIKEASIKQKTAERNTFMITLLITVILSAIVIVFYHQRQRAMSQLALKNEELHSRQVSEMLKEQEIKSIHAMLEGQDKERKRIAEDLHDRLGSTLSAVKLHLNALDGVSSTGMPLPLYQNLNGLLDKAVDEVRDIAHNMVSGVLTKFGLEAALRDLKETIEASRQVKVELMVLNLNERLEGAVEINLYRIIQELVSNILKHAKASEITIQLNKVNNELLLMVEDNGRGFDPSVASQQKGMGLRNIESRVSTLGGRLSIDSGRGRGTTTTIEIPLT